MPGGFNSESHTCKDQYTIGIIGFKRPGTPAKIGSQLFVLSDDNHPDSQTEEGNLGYKYESTEDSCVGRWKGQFRLRAVVHGYAETNSPVAVGGAAHAAAASRITVGESIVMDKSAGAKSQSLLDNLRVSLGTRGVTVSVSLTSSSTDYNPPPVFLQAQVDQYAAHNPGEAIQFTRSARVDTGVATEAGFLATATALADAGINHDSEANQPSPIFNFLPRIPLSCAGGS